MPDDDALVNPRFLNLVSPVGTHFEPVSALPLGCFSVTDLVKMDDVLFLVNSEESDGLISFDVKDPEHPKRLSGVPLPSFPVSMALSADGSFAFVCAKNHLAVVNVRDPACMKATRILCYEWEGSSPPARTCEVQGNALIVQHGGGAASVFDISDPRYPCLARLFHSGETVSINGLGIPEFKGTSRKIARARERGPSDSKAPNAKDLVIVEGDVEYCAPYEWAGFASHGHRLGLWTKVGGRDAAVIPLFGETRHLAKVGDYIYAMGGVLRVIDVSDPKSPKIVGWTRPCYADEQKAKDGGYYYTWIIPCKVTSNGKFALCHDYGRNHIFVDVRDKARPESIPFLFEGASDSFWDGDILYVHQVKAMAVYDAADPKNLKMLGRVEFANEGAGDNPYANDIKVRGKYAYLSCIKSGDLVVIDVEDKSAPKEVGRYDGAPYHGWYNLCEFALEGNYIYLPCAGPAGNDPEGPPQGIRVIDVSNPKEPKLAGHIRPNSPTEPYKKGLDQPNSVSVAGNLMVASDNFVGLKLFDISDRENPKFLDIDWRTEEYPWAGHGMSMANILEGDLVYTVTLGRLECHRIVKEVPDK